MATRKTSTSKSPKKSTGRKVTQSTGKSKKTTQSSSRTAGSLKKNLSTLTTSNKKQSKSTSIKSTSTTKRTSTRTSTTKNRGVKHTRCRTKALFPHNSMPWRLEPRTGKFNLSWFMCFDHAVDHIERIHLKPNDYKLQCYTSVPADDPLTGDVRTQRYVT